MLLQDNRRHQVQELVRGPAALIVNAPSDSVCVDFMPVVDQRRLEICLVLKVPVEAALRNVELPDQVIQAQARRALPGQQHQGLIQPLLSRNSRGFYVYRTEWYC